MEDVEYAKSLSKNKPAPSHTLSSQSPSASFEEEPTKNFKKGSTLTEAVLITYNRRRPGEIQAMRYF